MCNFLHDCKIYLHQTLPCRHSLNMDTSLLQTVLVVSETSTFIYSLPPLNLDHFITCTPLPFVSILGGFEFNLNLHLGLW